MHLRCSYRTRVLVSGREDRVWTPGHEDACRRCGWSVLSYVGGLRWADSVAELATPSDLADEVGVTVR